MKELGWQKENPFMPDMKTAADVKKYIVNGGFGLVENRVEKIFKSRIIELKEKILRFKSIGNSDVFLANLLLNSILIDTRALFLESDRHKRNSTLQNVYRARSLEDRAAAVDNLLDEKILNELSIRKIVKSWVDQRIVHIDWLWDDEEVKIFKEIEYFIFNDKVKNLNETLLKLISDYEEFISQYGDNTREQTELVMKAMTGD